MRKAIELKTNQVNSFKEKKEKSKSIVIINYLGLTVSELTNLRKELLENEMELKVYKNNIIRRSFEEVKELEEYLKGPNAVVFSYKEPYKVLKVLNDFSKKNDILEIKASVINGEFTDKDKSIELANVPSREESLSALINLLNTPLIKFGLILKELANKKES